MDESVQRRRLEGGYSGILSSRITGTPRELEAGLKEERRH